MQTSLQNLRNQLIKETTDYYLITSFDKGYLLNPKAPIAELIIDVFNRSGLDYGCFDITVNGKSLYDLDLSLPLNKIFYHIVEYRFELVRHRTHCPNLVKLLNVLQNLKGSVIPYNLVSSYVVMLSNHIRTYS